MLFILSIMVFLLFCFLALIFATTFNIKIDSGYLFGFFLFFDIYGFILAKILPIVTPLIFILIFSIFTIIFSALVNIDLFIKSLKSPFVIMWIIFTFYIIISKFWSPNQTYANFKVQLFILKGILPGITLYVSYAVFRMFNWKPVIFSGILYTVMFLLLRQYSGHDTGRMTLEGANPIWITRASLILVTIAMFSDQVTLLKKYALSTMGLIAGFLAQSKGPFIAMFASIYIHKGSNYYAQNLNQKFKLAKLFKLSLITLLILITIVSLIDLSGLLENTRFGVLFNFKKLFSEPSFLDRVVRSIKAVEMFFNNPLLGNGIGGFAIIDKRDYPHNIILEIGAELGIVGLFIWLLINLRLYSRIKDNKIFVLLFLQSIFYTFFSGDIPFNNEHILIGFMALGIIEYQQFV